MDLNAELLRQVLNLAIITAVATICVLPFVWALLVVRR